MLLNRTLKRDNLLNQPLDKRHSGTLSVGFKSKVSYLPPHQNKVQTQQLLNYKESLASGINHPRIRELILNHENISSLLSESSTKPKQTMKNNLTNLQLLQQRKWLTKKGKKYLIDFDDNERKQMKGCFNAMDLNKNGSIGIDQLEELLISVGLMQSREEVKQLIDSVDQDKSGKIEFSEFLKMILNEEGQNQQIVQFFKYVINFNRKKNDHAMDWKKNQSNSPDNLENNDKKASIQSSVTKKISLIHQKQNFLNSTFLQKSCFHQERNKFHISPENTNSNQTVNQNSALNIFENHPHPKNLPFGMIVSHIRRKHMLTALRIGQDKIEKMKKKSSLTNSQENQTRSYISSTALRSSHNMKDSKASLSQLKTGYTQQEVAKGQNVMNSLRKMWDRKLLREIREKKSKKQHNSKIIASSLTEKVKISKPAFPNLL